MNERILNIMQEAGLEVVSYTNESGLWLWMESDVWVCVMPRKCLQIGSGGKVGQLKAYWWPVWDSSQFDGETNDVKNKKPAHFNLKEHEAIEKLRRMLS